MLGYFDLIETFTLNEYSLQAQLSRNEYRHGWHNKHQQTRGKRCTRVQFFTDSSMRLVLSQNGHSIGTGRWKARAAAVASEKSLATHTPAPPIIEFNHTEQRAPTILDQAISSATNARSHQFNLSSTGWHRKPTHCSPIIPQSCFKP